MLMTLNNEVRDMRLKPDGGDPRLRLRKRGDGMIYSDGREAPPEVPTYGGLYHFSASPKNK